MFRRRLIVAGLVLASVLLLGERSAPAAVAATPTTPITVQLGAKPTWVAADPLTGRAYVTNSGEGTLTVIDLAGPTVVKTITVGRAPSVVALDPEISRAYVSDFEEGTVSVIDLSTHTVVGTVAVGGLGLAVDTKAHRVYAAGGRDIAVLDGATGEVIGFINAPAGTNLWGVAVDPAGGRVFATDLFSPRLLAFDPLTGALVGSAALSAPGRFAIEFDPTQGRVHVATYVRGSAELVSIDAGRLDVLGRVPIDDLPFALALDRGRGTVYSGSLTGGTVSVASPPRSTLTARLAAGGTHLGVAFVGDRLLVVDEGSASPSQRGRLLVIDLAGRAN